MKVIKYRKRHLRPGDFKAEGLPVEMMQSSGNTIILSFTRDLTAEEEAKLDTFVRASTTRIVEKASLTQKEAAAMNRVRAIFKKQV